MANSVSDGSYNYKYNGKELQDELGLNMYDYGARNYDPALGRFMNIDRLAEKFENLTPYQYANNTPTYFIDVNGEYVYINDPNDPNKRYRYQNGETQHEVDGEWVAIDENVKLSGFVLHTIAGLYHLESLSSTGKALINHFSGSENNISFQYEKDGAGYKKGIITLDHRNSGSTFVKEKGAGISLQKSPFYITISHEMAHGIDPVKNDFITTPWYTMSDGEPISKREIFATHYENMIRAESGLPLRSHYSYTINRTTGEALPAPQSRLIDKMGNSVYYGHNNNLNEPRQIGATINDGIKADGGQVLKSRFNYYEGR